MTTKWEGNHQSMEKPAEGANSAENWLDSLDNEESSTDFNTSVSKLLGSFSCLMSQNRAITESERQSLTSEVQRLSSIRKAIIESKKASKSKQKSSSRFSMSKLLGQAHLNKPQQCRPYDANGRRQDSNLLPMKLVPTNNKTTRKARVLVGSARLAAPPNKPVRHSSTSELVFPPPPPASITSDSSPVIPRRHQSPRKHVKVVKRLPELRAMGPPPMPVRYASPLKGCDKKDAFSSRDVGAPPSPPPSSDTSPIIPRRYQSPRKQVKYVGRRAEMSQMPSSSSLRRKKIEKQSAFLFEKGI